MKTSFKFKALCYGVTNFGVLFFSAVAFLQGVSAKMSLVIYLGSAAWVNLLYWALFRIRDNKGRL
jgi:hypothetical protein